VEFQRDIQPIFQSRCYSCHGEKKQESGLRLDLKSAALKGGDHGPLFLPKKSAASLLIQVTANTHPEIARMPKKGAPLTLEQIALLRAWIDQGASWPDEKADEKAERAKRHWAFKAPVRPPLPDVAEKQWVKNPIDSFILSRLEKAGLKPSPEADRSAWLRRLYLDLIGLPPSVEDTEAFLADSSPDACETVIEQLLRSPHYGERWGRHWLDAARYADSDGFEKDKLRFIWNYRDWVVSAFNRDLPYDQFIIEQIAGDLLPDATQDQMIATGFLRNSMLNEEGGIDPEQFRMDAMFDRMDAIGKSILGLTIQCGQCHSHKYDPLTQEEYYRLFAFLNNDHESTQVVYSPEELMLRDELSRKIREIEAGLKERAPGWEERMAKWEEEIKGNRPEWHILEVAFEGENDQRYFGQKDGSWLAAGYAPTKFTAEWEAKSPLPAIGAFRLELLKDSNLPCGGPGRSIQGLCALTELKVEVADAASPAKKVEVKFAKVTADFSNEERPLEAIFDDKTNRKRVTGPVEFAADGKDETAWGIDAGPGRRNVERQAVFAAGKNVAFPGGTHITFHVTQDHGGWNSDDNQNNNLGRFRFSVSSDPGAVADRVPRRLRDILAIPREKRSRAQTSAVFSYWRTTVQEWQEANGRIEALWKEWPAGSTTLTLKAREEPRDTRMLQRGDWLKPGKPITAAVPAFLHPLPEAYEPTRLTFARWLVDRRSPTTARVFMNRVWQAYFGTGIVDTPEDFGLQSSEPSHPELLDWLACEFIERGFSLKAIHRLIVSSAAYRQSSRVTPDLYAKDPVNRLLARGPRFRVEGEIVRDIALAASGLLNPKLAGPGIFTPAPSFLFQPPASYGPFNWPEETGPDRYRRGLYTIRRRSTPYPALQAFDVPNADFSCVRRARSNGPLQALTTLNETLFVECAQALARRILEKGGKTDDERISYAFRRVLGRPPAEDEKAEILGLLERQKKRIADGWVSAAELATGKSGLPDKLPEGVNPTQLAAYTAVSRVLLNLDETITKE
jgi:hypothetical protein